MLIIKIIFFLIIQCEVEIHRKYFICSSLELILFMLIGIHFQFIHYNMYEYVQYAIKNRLRDPSISVLHSRKD